jgi:cold shock CspA family protein
VLKVDLDKHNNLYGFIEQAPRNVFFHEFDNPDMDRSYIGKKVSYKIVRNGGQERAINVRLSEPQRNGSV